MAKVVKNMVTQGVSGRFGDQMVFRITKSGTVMASKPYIPEGRTPTALQLAAREEFSRAIIYAKAAMKDPELSAEYETKAVNGASVFNVAVRDYLSKPTVNLISTDGYTGAVGDKILVNASDAFKIVAVKIEIKGSDGHLIESGQAIQQPLGVEWIYTSTSANATPAGSSVTATASDRAGNSTPFSVTIV